MNWEQKAVIACRKRGFYLVGFEDWFVFMKTEDGEVFPVLEETVAKWIMHSGAGGEN